MSKFFEDALVIFLQDAKEKLLSEIEAAEAKASTNGYLLSGKLWMIREQIILDSVKKYGENLIVNLTKYENEHTPISLNDFQLARESIEAFSVYCEQQYRARTENKIWRYPKNRALFDGDKLARETAKAIAEIEGNALVFKSKRSFWKWALGDARKKIWTSGVAFFFTITGALLVPLAKSIWHNIAG